MLVGSRSAVCIRTALDRVTDFTHNLGCLDLVTFVCIVACIKKFKANLGQAHTMSHLMKTLVKDSTIYFFIMLTFNVAMLVYAVMARASLKNFPLVYVLCFCFFSTMKR